MMLKNLVCSAFLAAALADVAPSPTFMSTITTAGESGLRSTRNLTSACPPPNQSRLFGPCSEKCPCGGNMACMDKFDFELLPGESDISQLPNVEKGNGKCWPAYVAPTTVATTTSAPTTVATTTSAPTTVDKPVDVVVELGSSKSKIVVVKSEGDKIKLVKIGDSIKTKVTIGKKGVAGACRNDWSTEAKCEKHLNDIATTLQEADKAYNIRSVRFLGTAGLRQSPQGVETLQKLEKKIESITSTFQRQDMEFEYRTLSGEEEAENEFLALKSAKDGVEGPDKTEENELVGNIGLGGASLQYAVEEKADQQSGKKGLSLESVPRGLDAAWELLKDPAADTEGGDCKMGVSAEQFEECRAQIKSISEFNPLFKHNNSTHWAQDHLKVYVLGGIYWSIRKSWNKNELDHTRDELYGAAKARCNKMDYGAEDFEDDSYLKYQCFRLTYIVHVIDSLGIDAGKTDADKKTIFHFRKELPGFPGKEEKKLEWVRAAVMKKNTPDNEFLRAYVDTTSATTAAVQAYKERVAKYESVKAETQ